MKTILIVEDDETSREWLELKLYQKRYTVEVAESAEQSLKLLDSILFSVLLTDMQLPEMQGLELIRKAKIKQPNIHVIAMSSIIENYCTPLIYMGVADFFEKPVDIDRLYGRLDVIFSRSSS